MVGFTKQEMLTELREIIFQYARITSFVIDAEAGFRMLRCERDYGDKWSAQIWVNGVCKNLGTYDSEKEAVEIRQLATEMMHGAFANTKSYKAGVQA